MPTTLEKPAGLSVFPLHTDPGSDCMLRRLLADAPEKNTLPWPAGFAGGIAHRLDIPTSGALWVADDPAELAHIREAFASGSLRKTYRFVAAGEVPWQSHSIDRALAHDRRKRRRMIVERGASTPHRGRWLPARTHFRRIEGPLWEAVIETGVMHQIRVHAAFLGLPLLGDPLYGRGAVPREVGPGAVFLLHHLGLSGAGLRTDPVELPAWAQG